MHTYTMSVLRTRFEQHTLTRADLTIPTERTIPTDKSPMFSTGIFMTFNELIEGFNLNIPIHWIFKLF